MPPHAPQDHQMLSILREELTAHKPRGMTSYNLLWSLAISMLMLVGQVAAFSLLRKQLRNVYEPRSFMVPKQFRVDSPPSGFFAWIPEVINAPLSTLVPVVGLDAYFFLRYIALLACLGISIAFILIPTLFPIHYTGGNNSPQFLDRFTIANISPENNIRYTSHLVLSYVVLLVCLAFFHSELRSYYRIRAKHLVENYTPHTSTTLLIKGLYPEYCTEEILRDHFGQLAVHINQIWFNRNYNELCTLIARSDSLIHSIETRECFELSASHRKPALLKDLAARYQIGNNGQSFSELNYIVEQVKTFQSEIDLFEPVNSCFIEFDSRLACFIAERSINTIDRPVPGLYCFAKVYSKDIIWENLSMPTWIEVLIKNLTIVLDYSVILGWAIPVSAVSMVTQVEYIVQIAPSFKWMLAYPYLSKVMSSVVAPLALSSLTSQVPSIFRWLATWKGYPTRTEVELDVQKYLFIFLFLQLFLIVTLATGIPGLVMRMVTNTTEGAITLASSLPKATNFFIAYLIASSFSTSGNTLLQVEVLWWRGWSEFWALTPRAKFRHIYGFPAIKWGTAFPSATNLGAIALAYALVSPIILIASTIGCVLIFVAFKYRLIYSHMPKNTADGDYFPRAIMQLFSGIYCQQISLLGTLLLVDLPVHALFAIVLILFSVVIQNRLSSMCKELDAKIPIERSAEPQQKQPTHTFSFTERWEGIFQEIAVEFRNLQAKQVVPKQIFEHPAVCRAAPVLWLPRDAQGCAQKREQWILDQFKNLQVSTNGALVLESGTIKITDTPPDYDPYELIPR